jgi:phage shock protein PspC (stress-responsive transcriptional regulator)
MAFCMLVLAFAFQIPRLEGASFYTNHPITSSLFSNVSRHATAFFYVAVAFTFLAMDRIRTAPVDLRIARKDRVILDAGDFRSIIGLVSGLGRVTGLDPAYIRVAFVLLNVLTFGLVGLIYLLYYVWLRRSGRKEYEHSTTIEEPKFIRPLGAVVRITLGFLFLLLALIRVSTEFRLFFFNEPFFQGIVLILVGCIFTASALRSHQRAGFERLWLLGGAVVLLNGIYELTTAVFQVQLPFAGRFELIYLVGGLSVAYYSLVSLNGQRQRAGFGLAALFFLAALMVQASLAPTHLMLALVQFYDFFFPVIFAGFGLWLVLES